VLLASSPFQLGLRFARTVPLELSPFQLAALFHQYARRAFSVDFSRARVQPPVLNVRPVDIQTFRVRRHRPIVRLAPQDLNQAKVLRHAWPVRSGTISLWWPKAHAQVAVRVPLLKLRARQRASSVMPDFTNLQKKPTRV
jgi:hypothetical protein